MRKTEKGTENLLEEIKAENLTNLAKEIDIQNKCQEKKAHW